MTSTIGYRYARARHNGSARFGHHFSDLSKRMGERKLGYSKPENYVHKSRKRRSHK